MICREPDIKESDRYSTKQTAEILQVHECTIRRYTKQGYLKCGVKRHNGRRFYTGREILRFYKATL